MNGSAPYCPTTGSQVVPARNDHPNFSRGKVEFMYSSNTSSAARARMVSAQVSVTTYAISSPLRRRCQKAEARPEGRAFNTGVGEAAIRDDLLDLIDLLEFLGDDRFRQRGIEQSFGHLLTVRQHPRKEILDGLLFHGIGNLGRNQQPGEARNRIDALARRIRDRYTKILRHVLRPSCRGRHAWQARQDEFTRGILHFAEGHLVLNGVSQFNVADRVRDLLDRSRYALVALAGESDRPVDRGSAAGL